MIDHQFPRFLTSRQRCDIRKAVRDRVAAGYLRGPEVARQARKYGTSGYIIARVLRG